MGFFKFLFIIGKTLALFLTYTVMLLVGAVVVITFLLEGISDPSTAGFTVIIFIIFVLWMIYKILMACDNSDDDE